MALALAPSVVPNGHSTHPVQTPQAPIPSEDRAEEALEIGLKKELRKELRKWWYSLKEEEFSEGLVYSWISGPNPANMLSIDGSAISTLPLCRWDLVRFCNKATVLYWAHSAQEDNDCPRFIWGCIWKEWFRCYDQVPRLDFAHFFANPVGIESTGPSTVLELLETHKHICNRTASFLESDQAHKDGWPDRFKLLPICRAIIIVLDELVPVCIKENSLYLDLEAQRQNVVMVRTGDEIGLSAPISFEGIRDLALPLARPDAEKYGEIDAIRVPLATAVQFIVHLERREEIAFPESAPGTAVEKALYPSTYDGRSQHDTITNADDWVDRIMELVDEKGVENTRMARGAMLAVQAARRGEPPELPYPSRFGHRWI